MKIKRFHENSWRWTLPLYSLYKTIYVYDVLYAYKQCFVLWDRNFLSVKSKKIFKIVDTLVYCLQRNEEIGFVHSILWKEKKEKNTHICKCRNMHRIYFLILVLLIHLFNHKDTNITLQFINPHLGKPNKSSSLNGRAIKALPPPPSGHRTMDNYQYVILVLVCSLIDKILMFFSS